MFVRVFRLQSVIGFVAIALVLGGCANKDDVSPAENQAQAFEDLRNEVRDAVDDTTREDEAIELVNALSANLTELQEKISQRAKRTRELNADYDTTHAAFEAYFGEVDQHIQANRKQVTETQRALFEILTPDE